MLAASSLPVLIKLAFKQARLNSKTVVLMLLSQIPRKEEGGSLLNVTMAFNDSHYLGYCKIKSIRGISYLHIDELK